MIVVITAMPVLIPDLVTRDIELIISTAAVDDMIPVRESRGSWIDCVRRIKEIIDGKEAVIRDPQSAELRGVDVRHERHVRDISIWVAIGELCGMYERLSRLFATRIPLDTANDIESKARLCVLLHGLSTLTGRWQILHIDVQSSGDRLERTVWNLDSLRLKPVKDHQALLIRFNCNAVRDFIQMIGAARLEWQNMLGSQKQDLAHEVALLIRHYMYDSIGVFTPWKHKASTEQCEDHEIKASFEAFVDFARRRGLKHTRIMPMRTRETDGWDLMFAFEELDVLAKRKRTLDLWQWYLRSLEPERAETLQ